MIVAVVAAVSGNGRLFFHPEISIWLGVGLNVGPGSAGLGPYCAQKIEKRGIEDLLVALELFWVHHSIRLEILSRFAPKIA